MVLESSLRGFFVDGICPHTVHCQRQADAAIKTIHKGIEPSDGIFSGSAS